MLAHRKRFCKINEYMRQKLCIFEQNFVFFSMKNVLFEEKKKLKRQISYCSGKWQNEMFLYELWKQLTLRLCHLLLEIKILTCWNLNIGNIIGFLFTCIQNNHTSLFLLAVKLPNHLPLQNKEMYYYNHISLNPMAQLSGQSYKHRKRGLHTPSAWLTWRLWMKVICFPGSWVRLCLFF